MRKLIFMMVVSLVLGVVAEARMAYECSFEATGGGVVHGSYVTVYADSKAEAEQKAREKIKANRGRDAVIKYIRCK